MFWNCVNNMSCKFVAKFHVAPSEIHMSQYFYERLFKEMCGAQWWSVLLHNSVRGMKIVISHEEHLFTLVGGGHTLTATSLHETKWV